jgi:hypothetical protein
VIRCENDSKASNERTQLAVDLRLGRWTRMSSRAIATRYPLRTSRSNGAPADEIGDVLRRDDVQELDAGRQSHGSLSRHQCQSWLAKRE